jgi:hypothetical protein
MNDEAPSKFVSLSLLQSVTASAIGHHPSAMQGLPRKKRASVTSVDAMLSSINADDEHQTRHLAELLEISGAENISDAVKIQVAAMKTRDEGHVMRMFKKLKDESNEEDLDHPRRPTKAGGFGVVLAAGKLMQSVKVRDANCAPARRNRWGKGRPGAAASRAV